MVEVITTQVCITIGRLNLKHTIAKLQDGDIERTATKVEHCDALILVRLVKSVGKCCRCRLVDDTHYLQAGDLSCILCGLTL